MQFRSFVIEKQCPTHHPIIDKLIDVQLRPLPRHTFHRPPGILQQPQAEA